MSLRAWHEFTNPLPVKKHIPTVTLDVEHFDITRYIEPHYPIFSDSPITEAHRQHAALLAKTIWRALIKQRKDREEDLTASNNKHYTTGV